MKKGKDTIEEATRNPTVSPRTGWGNLSVNVTVQNANDVSYMRNQAAFEKNFVILCNTDECSGNTV